MQNDNTDNATTGVPASDGASATTQSDGASATTQSDGTAAVSEDARKQDIEDFAQHIREEVAEAKRTGVQEGSATAKHIEEEVELIKKEAAKLSPEAFSDLKQHEIKVETIE